MNKLLICFCLTLWAGTLASAQSTEGPAGPGVQIPGDSGADMPSWDDSDLDGAMPSMMNDTDDGAMDNWDSWEDDEKTPDDIQILITIPQDGGMPSVSESDIDDYMGGDDDSMDNAMPSTDGAMPSIEDKLYAPGRFSF